MVLDLVNLEYVEEFSDNGETLKLRLSPLSLLDKLRVADAYERLGMAAGAEILLGCAVKGWLDVNEPDGKTVGFDYGKLDTLLGKHPALAEKLIRHLRARNGMEDKEDGRAPLAG